MFKQEGLLTVLKAKDILSLDEGNSTEDIIA